MDDSQIVLFADFDSGNMARYEKVLKTINSNALQTTNSTNPSNTTAPPVSFNSSNASGENTAVNTAINADNAQKAAPNNQTPINQPKYDVEYNVWTRPDCFGTPHQNANR